MCLALTGCCGTNVTDDGTEPQLKFTDAIEESINRVSALPLKGEEEEIEASTQDIEDEEPVNLDSWIGKYNYDEINVDDNMFMDYDIEIYKGETRPDIVLSCNNSYAAHDITTESNRGHILYKAGIGVVIITSFMLLSCYIPVLISLI